MLNRFIKLPCFLRKATTLGVCLLAGAVSASGVVPSVVISSQSVQVKTYLTGATTANLSDPTKIVMDGSGNLFFVDGGPGTLYELQLGATTATAIISGLGSGAHGLAVDSYGDVIVSATYNYHVYFLPVKNGTLCTTCNAAGTGPLDLTGAYGFGTLSGYYGSMSDVAVDANGLVYIAMSSCNVYQNNACGTSHNSIFTVKTAGPTTTASTIGISGASQLFLGALPSPYGNYAISLALDGSGHLFFADGINVYICNTTSPSPVTIGSFTAPQGVSLDAAGNLYVSDYSTKLLYEIPIESGTLNAAHRYVVAAPSNPQYPVAFDAAGNFYSGGGYTNGTVSKTTLGAINLGPSPVGTASATGTLTFFFNAAVTPTAFKYVQATNASTEFKLSYGTCAVGTAYTAGQSCTQVVYVTPSSTGIRKGAIQMQTASSTALATAYMAGTGSGPALTADPGTQLSLTPKNGTWVAPKGVAMDAAGNVYVADPGANAVQAFSATGTAIGSVGSGLSSPSGVAVDGAGNLFICDTGSGRIFEVPNENGTLNTADQAVLVSTGLSKPQSVAVDATGAIYVADTNNQRVLRFTTFDGLGALQQSTIGSGYTTPVALTTDLAGNVYVADSGLNQIDSINLAGSLTVALKGLSSPTGIALDASNSAYVVNSGANTVLRVPNVGGSLNMANSLAIGPVFTVPGAVAVNGSGNAVISDTGAPAVYLLSRTAGTLNFGNVNFGSASSTQTVTLTSAGTSTVTLGSTVYTASGATADYAVTSACTASQVLSVGATCTLAGTLTPVVTSGTLNELLTFSSNAVNASPITELLTGVATNLSPTTTTIAVTSSSSPIYGQSVTVVATVTSQRAGYTPTGTVTFTADGAAQTPVPALTQSGSTYTASFTFPALKLSAGTHAITASYSGDTLNASSASSTPAIVTLAKQATGSASAASAALVVPPATIPPAVSQPAGSTFYFYVTVSPAIAGGPTGTVELVAANTTSPVLATATLNASYQATIAYAPPASGSYQIIYVGDSNFVSSTSNTTTVQIRNVTYDVTLNSSSYTVTGGQSVAVPITITGISGYAGNVTVSSVLAGGVTTPACTGLPAYTTCTFSPGFIPLSPTPYPAANPSGVFNLTISTNQPPATPYPIPGALLWPGLLGGVTAMMRRKRKGGRRGLPLLGLCVVLTSLLLAANGCGNGTTQYQTPKGTSTVTLTFSGSPASGAVSPANPNIVNTQTIQLTVQ